MPQRLLFGGTILSPTLEGSSYVLKPLEALLIRDGRIAAVGRLSEVEHLVTPDTQRIHLEGRTLLPGFNDAHVHIWKVGQLRTTLLDLRGSKAWRSSTALWRRGPRP